MRYRSKTNSRKHRHEDLQQDYRNANGNCELSDWFLRYFPELPITDFRLDLHHICRLGRKDYWSNLIRVCHSIHAWDDVRPVEMKVICMWHKAVRKNELDWNELNRCSVGRMQAWVERHEPELEAFRQPWRELCAFAAERKDSGE